MNILVADDELAIRSLVGELLTDEGHVVTLAEDGGCAGEIQERVARDRFQRHPDAKNDGH